jgi:2,5-diamino-6-(ribosylamino)-4(3H)-pyrimidinone 5'-phosphate reductase
MNNKKRPFVFLCTGMSLDGKISNFKKECSPISSCDDREMLYDARVGADAIAIGANTLRRDDSGLTIKGEKRKKRRAKLGKNTDPAKVVFISDANDLKTRGDFFDRGEGEIFVFTTVRTNKEKIAEMQKKAFVHVGRGKKVDLEKAMEILFEKGIRSVLLEGGGEIIYSFLEKGLVDEINLKIGNLILGGRDTATLVDGKGFDIPHAKKIKFLKVETFPNYIIIKAKII